MFARTKVAAVVAEFLGVAVITSALLAIGKSGVGYSYFLAGGVGLSVAAMALAVGRLSGAQFNPATTIGLWTTRKLKTPEAVAYIAAQMLGAVAAWRLYVYVASQAIPVASRTFSWRIFVAEGVGALIITMIYASAVYQGYRGLKFAAVLGGGVFLGMLVASMGSNGIGNPAIALGVRAWSWEYVAAPIIGGVLGVNLYAYLFSAVTPLDRVVPARAKSRGPTAKKKPVARRKRK